VEGNCKSEVNAMNQERTIHETTSGKRSMLSVSRSVRM